MKVKLPASAYLRGSLSELHLSGSGIIDTRVMYYGIGDGEYTTDALGTFMGQHGPRFSLKPVYHVKPVAQSEYGLYTVSGKVVEPSCGGNYLGAALRSWITGYVAVINSSDFQTTTANSLLDRIRVDVELGYVFTGYRSIRYARWVSLTLWLYPAREVYNAQKIRDQYDQELVRQLLTDIGIGQKFCPYLGQYRRAYASSQAEARIRISGALYSLLDELARRWKTITNEISFSDRTTSYPFPATAVGKYDPVLPVDLFHNEDRFRGDPVFDLTNYWIDSGRQHAFVEAVQSVPRMNDNNIANIFQFASFIYTLVVRREVQIPASLQDAWLSYRYSYNTTKMDIQEAIKFMRRHAHKYLNGFGLRSYGAYTFEYEGISVTIRCSVRIRNKQLDVINRVWRALDTYGLRPDFYIVWDSIPFSFIVDWFMPIGDVMSVADVRQRIAEYYDFYGITYSITYESLQDGIRWKTYRRWVESAPPELSGIYWLEDGNVSNKLAMFRTLDLASLILG